MEDEVEKPDNLIPGYENALTFTLLTTSEITEDMFLAGQWLSELLKLRVNYNQLDDYLSSSTAISAYLKIQTKFTYEFETDRLSQMPLEESHPLWKQQLETFVSIRLYHNRQQIISLATYIELAVHDFLKALFVKHPIRMYDYLYHVGKNDVVIEGVVSLKVITKAENLSVLIADLAEQAASNSQKGSFSSGIKNLSKIAKQTIPNALEVKLVRIIKLRNQIVHEASEVKLKREEVEGMINTVENLISFLTRIAKSSDLPIDTDITEIFTSNADE